MAGGAARIDPARKAARLHCVSSPALFVLINIAIIIGVIVAGPA